jgi:hypothetical protein
MGLWMASSVHQEADWLKVKPSSHSLGDLDRDLAVMVGNADSVGCVGIRGSGTNDREEEFG